MCVYDRIQVRGKCNKFGVLFEKASRGLIVQKPKVYVTRELPERGLRVIQERFDVEIWPKYAPPPKEVIVQKSSEVDGLATLLSDKIDSEVLDAGSNLRIVSICSRI